MQFLSWTNIEVTKEIQVLSDYIISHHHFCIEITSKCIKTLRPLTTMLEVGPDWTITLRHALLLLYQLYKIGCPPNELPLPIIINSSQNPDNPTYIMSTASTKI